MKQDAEFLNSIPMGVSSRLANLGFVAACLVVTIHIPTGGAFRTLFSSGIAQAMVPIFFFISGVLASIGVRRYGWRKLLCKKFRTLVLPYILLNILTYGVACIELLNGRPWSSSPKMTEISFNTFLLSLGFAKTRWCFLYPLWYVRCLFLLFCMLPSLWWFLTCSRRLVTFLTLCGLLVLDLSALLLGLRYTSVELSTYWFSTMGLLCFALGMSTSIHWRVLREHRLVRIVVMDSAHPARMMIGLAGVVAAGCLSFLKTDSILITVLNIHYLITPLVMASLYLLMPDQRFPKMLVSNTFGIYVLHVIVIHYSESMCTAGVSDFGRLLYWFFVVLTSLGISELLHRCMPRVSGLLFGGR